MRANVISSRKLSDLTPATQIAAAHWLAECAAEGYDVLVTCTYRDAEAQNALYAQGRTAPGNIVTNAKGGQSKHQQRIAIDFCPMSHGKCLWNDLVTFKFIGEIAERNGFEWAGRWKGSMRESAHIQLIPGS